MTAVNVIYRRDGPSASKIVYSMTFTGESETDPIIYTIDNLVVVKLKSSAKLLRNKMNFSVSFSSSKHDSAKEKNIKINVNCLDLKYSELNIEVPNDWSKWQEMGLTQPYVRNGLYYTTVSIVVTAYECKKETVLSKLYTDSVFTDFHLVTSEGSVPVHKACLAAHSDVFKAMLTNEWKEAINGEIRMKGATVKTLQQLKEYMYLGTVPEDGLRPLLLIARCYLIEDLEKHCIRKLAENATGETLFSLLEFACDNNIPELSYAMLVITQEAVVNEAKDIKTAVLNSQKSKQSHQ
ncbi:TD and POZ domain-containing protein 5-like [Cydia pomonella]|uniref:TD and POZ domain-containing protein 5-like n=1 Tax=Cydia pomonella TaxID=82600 RepID=UPI002ADE0AD5|nr:TD and POZ domain-containing protein 5-like [Cydia pomonella]XP_061721036.1 TD and POZ domain-containing protein 5-like [Cydia pomonella]